MKLSKQDTTALWNSVRDNDHAAFARINAVLLNAPTPLKHIPVRLFIPSSPKPPPPPSLSSPSSSAAPSSAAAAAKKDSKTKPPAPAEAGAFKVVQSLVPATVASPRGPGAIPNRLGLALQKALPGLFPSSRDPVLASVVLHGAAVPFSAPLEELMRDAAYPDGWLYLVVVLL
jgi:autophagy-related protein 5